ncbi:hypothetical protein B0T09DRAFT_340833 [Sordaria sp. MPI-SDFR-AT-0083]|nr:hypothetical protein B0T09DRAFT_340833 [Sordaria sp. MPI-SDFR-AT-0083]
MRLAQLKVGLAVGAGLSNYVRLATAAVAALPALVGREASIPPLIVARDGGSVEGGYYNLCQPNTGLKKHTDNGSPVMSGVCGSNQNGQQKYSLLNLNPCYANINGDLFPVTDGKGDFSKTCRDCFMPSGVENPAKKYMKCMCQQAGGDKVEKETQVDLDQHIHVVDDKLGCPGAEGEFPYWLPDGIVPPPPSIGL